MSAFGQMEALTGNQERRIRRGSCLGSGGFKIRLDVKLRGRVVFANQTSTSWNLIASLHCFHFIEGRLKPWRLLVVQLTLIIKIEESRSSDLSPTSLTFYYLSKARSKPSIDICGIDVLFRTFKDLSKHQESFFLCVIFSKYIIWNVKCDNIIYFIQSQLNSKYLSKAYCVTRDGV